MSKPRCVRGDMCVNSYKSLNRSGKQNKESEYERDPILKCELDFKISDVSVQLELVETKKHIIRKLETIDQVLVMQKTLVIIKHRSIAFISLNREMLETAMV